MILFTECLILISLSQNKSVRLSKESKFTHASLQPPTDTEGKLYVDGTNIDLEKSICEGCLKEK